MCAGTHLCAYGRWLVTRRLLTTDGDLLGTTAEVGRMEQEHIIAAIMSNVFGEYERAGNECLGEPNLKFLLFSFEVRRGCSAAWCNGAQCTWQGTGA